MSHRMKKLPVAGRYRGAVAENYDRERVAKEETQIDQEIVERFLTELEPGRSVLDLPAGTGRFVSCCASRRIPYTGMDVSEDMLRVARTRAGDTPPFVVVGDARALPFRDQAFDACVSVKFIKWVPTFAGIAGIFSEIARVTRQRSLIQVRVVERGLLSMPLWLERLIRAARRRAKGKVSGTRFYTDSQVRRALKEAGFEVSRVIDGKRMPDRLGRTAITRFYEVSKTAGSGGPP